jgi:YebC/PmpR family DNA-binding regulatory protein
LSAKAVNMPADNIKKAIQKGTGELPGVAYDEVQYEAYGPAGVAILIQTLTDNRNRTVSEIRHILSKNGGNMGEAGCVSWMFHKLGQIEVDGTTADEDVVLEAALEAGAADVVNFGTTFSITTAPNDLDSVKNALEGRKIPIATAELAMVPQTMIKLEERAAEQMLRLMEALEEHDDVQKVYANFDIDDSILERISSE